MGRTDAPVVAPGRRPADGPICGALTTGAVRGATPGVRQAVVARTRAARRAPSDPPLPSRNDAHGSVTRRVRISDLARPRPFTQATVDRPAGGRAIGLPPSSTAHFRRKRKRLRASHDAHELALDAAKKPDRLGIVEASRRRPIHARADQITREHQLCRRDGAAPVGGGQPLVGTKCARDPAALAAQRSHVREAEEAGNLVGRSSRTAPLAEAARKHRPLVVGEVYVNEFRHSATVRERLLLDGNAVGPGWTPASGRGSLVRCARSRPREVGRRQIPIRSHSRIHPGR